MIVCILKLGTFMLNKETSKYVGMYQGTNFTISEKVQSSFFGILIIVWYTSYMCRLLVDKRVLYIFCAGVLSCSCEYDLSCIFYYNMNMSSFATVIMSNNITNGCFAFLRIFS